MRQAGSPASGEVPIREAEAGMATDCDRGADLLVEALIRAGVDTVFGVPGDTGVVFYDALYRRMDEIRHILARDERHAAYMADAYARSTGTVSAVEASSGGGVTYLVGGLGDAYASSVPLLVITSDIRRDSRGTGALTEIDQRKVFSAVTKWCAVADSAECIPDLVAEACSVATTGRPGPTTLVVPEDVLDEDASAPMFRQTPLTSTHERPAPDQSLVARAARALASAEQPAIVVGSGVHLAGAWQELSAVADGGGIPVATTIHGKGAIDESSQWSLGVLGANGARPYTNDWLANADAVLFVGTRANATDTNSFSCPPRECPALYHLDIDPSRAGASYPEAVRLIGDAKVTLARLFEELPPADPERAETRRRWIAEQRAGWGEDAHRTRPLPEPDWLDPKDAVLLLAERLGPETRLVADPGTPTPNVAAYWECSAGARRVIVPRGHGPMGYAIPAALGVALAHPGERVICLTTEGSLAMACGELETAGRLGLPVTYVLFDNRSMGWIKMLQHLYADRRYFGVAPGPIDGVQVASAMGVPASRATGSAEFLSLVEASLDQSGPMLIEVRVPDQVQLPPPVAPWQAALAGASTSRPAY